MLLLLVCCCYYCVIIIIVRFNGGADVAGCDNVAVAAADGIVVWSLV